MSAEPVPFPPELLAEPPFTDADVDRWLLTDEPNPDWPDNPADEPVARWVIDGDGSAAWSMAKLSGIASELRSVSEQATEWRERIDAWQEQRSKPLSRHYAFFEGHLADYALRVREASGDEIKTVTLPTGVVKTTGHKAAVVVADADSFLSWAKGLADEDRATVVQVTEKPILSGLRQMVEAQAVAQVVTLSCGCSDVHTVEGRLLRSADDKWADDTWSTVWLGDGVRCPSCGDDALVAKIESSYLIAFHPSLGEVPGLTVEGERVSTKVIPDV